GAACELSPSAALDSARCLVTVSDMAAAAPKTRTSTLKIGITSRTDSLIAAAKKGESSGNPVFHHQAISQRTASAQGVATDSNKTRSFQPRRQWCSSSALAAAAIASSVNARSKRLKKSSVDGGCIDGGLSGRPAQRIG